MEIKGITELKKKLDALENNVAKKVVRQALRAAAKVSQVAMISSAPVGSGATKQSLKVRAGKKRQNKVNYFAGLTRKLFTGKQWYAAAVELGHKQGKRIRTSKKDSKTIRDYAAAKNAARVQVPAKHWMKLAFEKSAQAAADTACKKIAEGIEKAAQGKSSGSGEE